MSGPDDLLRKLDALSEGTARFGTRGRIISDGGLPSPVQAILTEVGETVLAQDLTFHFGDIGALTLIVSGHRVLAVRAVEGLMMPNVAAQLVGKPLTSATDGTQRAFVALMMQIDLLRDTIETVSDAGPPFAAPPGTGLSAERLAALLGIAYPVTPPTVFDRFRALLEPAPSASLLIEPAGTTDEIGDAHTIARMHAVAEALGLPDNWAKVSPKLSVIGQQSGTAPLIGALFDKSGIFLWTIEGAHVGVCAQAFHKIFQS